MVTGPVVDTPSAQEFQREILGRVTAEELQAIATDLDRKSRAIRELLLPDPARLDRAALRQVLRLTFATRRHADQILDGIGPERLGAAIAELLRDGEAPAARFDRFSEMLAAYPGPGFDLPSELLHFTYPDRYWLWTRWLWDPRSETGALGLVTDDAVLSLPGLTEDSSFTRGAAPRTPLSRGAIYLTVGRAVAFVDETGKAAGFTAAGPGLFGADVFLAAVYGIYMYTVLRMRMTREFSRLVPPLPDLIRRLLGVYHLEG